MRKLNKTIYELSPRDKDNPWNMYDARLWELKNDELLIMLAILSNKTEKTNPDDKVWVLNRIEIEKRLQKGGMGWRNFRKAWDMLKIKGYIVCNRKQGYVEWVVKENPNINIIEDKTKNVRPPVFRGPYSKKETNEVKKDIPVKYNPWGYDPNNPLSEEQIKSLGERGEKIYRGNMEDYKKRKIN